MIAPGESGIGIRIVYAHFFKHCFSPGKHADDVEQILCCLVLKVVHEHLGIPGVIRFHAVVVFAIPGFKLQRPVVFSSGVEHTFVDGTCRNTLRSDLQARQGECRLELCLGDPASQTRGGKGCPGQRLHEQYQRQRRSNPFLHMRTP